MNDTGHLQADLIQGPSGPIHQLLKESHSLRPWDKQHLGLIQQVLEVNLGLVLGPVPHRKFCFMFHYWWVRERRLIMEPDRRELEKVPTFLLVLSLLYKPFWLGTGLLERQLSNSKKLCWQVPQLILCLIFFLVTENNNFITNCYWQWNGTTYNNSKEMNWK